VGPATVLYHHDVPIESSGSDESVYVLLQVRLPDRPGGLGLVASRIGALRGDIVDVTVLDHRSASAVDQLTVRLGSADHLRMVVREVEEVDGVTVEAARLVADPRDPGAETLRTISALLEAHNVSELQRSLAHGIRRRFVAEWAMVVTADAVVATSGPAPALSGIPGARPATGNEGGEADGSDAADGESTGDPGVDHGDGTLAGGTIARGLLPEHGAEVLVGRPDHPFYPRECAMVRIMSRMADAVWGHHDSR